MTGGVPFAHANSEKAQSRIKDGERPDIPSSVQESADPFDHAMLKVIEMCWIQDPIKRASAREIQEFIISKLQRLGVKED